MKRFTVLAILLAGIIGLSGCSFLSDRVKPSPAELSISATASLKDAMNKIKTSFEEKNEGITLTFTYSSTADLVAQIEDGFQTDFFISSSQKEMNELQDKDLIDVSTRKNFVTNPLVLIGPKDSPLTSVESLTSYDVGQIVIGDPVSVPAGQYAQEAFTKMGLISEIQDKLIYGEDVAQILSYVADGEAQAGVVYKSDAVSSDQVKIIAEFPAGSYNMITYPMAQLKSSQYPEQVKKFEDFLLSTPAQDIMHSYGFSTPATTSTD